MGGIARSSSTTNAAASASVKADFNGDGYADLAIGAPIETVGTVEEAGAVNVLNGSAAS